LRAQTANSRSEVTPHLDILDFLQDETAVEGFITLRCQYGVLFGPFLTATFTTDQSS